MSHEINQIHSPITRNIDQISELIENENIQNISNFSDSEKNKINTEEMINYGVFDDENEKNNEKDEIIIKFEEKENLIHLDKDENETDISTKKVPLANYMQVLYDQNSERLKKRSQQMRKMKEKLHIINDSNGNKEKNDNNNKTDTKSRKIPNTKIFLEKEENLQSSILEQAMLSTAKEINKNDDTELVISDLDCPLEEELIKTQNRHSKNSLSLNLPSKSFIHLTNNLLMKSHAKPDNQTPDYLLALNQCETEDMSTKEEIKNEFMKDKHLRFPSVNVFICIN